MPCSARTQATVPGTRTPGRANRGSKKDVCERERVDKGTSVALAHALQVGYVCAVASLCGR